MPARALLLSGVAEALCCSQQFLYDHLDRDTGIIDFGRGVTLRAVKTARWVVPEAELARFLGETHVLHQPGRSGAGIPGDTEQPVAHGKGAPAHTRNTNEIATDPELDPRGRVAS
jgi:hypothetical protein